MSTAPRSCTPVKQRGSTTGSSQARGSVTPGFGMRKRMLRSASSICSSLPYSRSDASACDTGPRPTLSSSVGFPSATTSGMSSVTRPSCALTSMPPDANAASCAADQRPELGDVEIAVDHAVGPEADLGELVRETCVRRAVVPVVRMQADAERGKELRVGDVLLLRADDPPRDLEALLRREPGRKQAHDAVVLAREERVHRGQPDVAVRPRVPGDDRVLRRRDEGAEQFRRGRLLRIAAGAHSRQVSGAGQQKRRRVVCGPAVELPDAQPVQPLRGDAVDVGRVDVAAQPIDVLPRRRHTRAVRRRRAPEVDGSEIGSKRLQWIGRMNPIGAISITRSSRSPKS